MTLADITKENAINDVVEEIIKLVHDEAMKHALYGGPCNPDNETYEYCDLEIFAGNQIFKLASLIADKYGFKYRIRLEPNAVHITTDLTVPNPNDAGTGDANGGDKT